MTYLSIYHAATNEDFQARCRVATWKAAQDIVAEDPATSDHAMRAEWASQVLNDTAAITDRQLAMQVLRNPVIAADPALAEDDAIQYQVNSILPSIIGLG